MRRERDGRWQDQDKKARDGIRGAKGLKIGDCIELNEEMR